MSVDVMVVVSNALVFLASMVLALVTLMDVHKEDQKTIRAILLGHVETVTKLGRRVSGKGRHED